MNDIKTETRRSSASLSRSTCMDAAVAYDMADMLNEERPPLKSENKNARLTIPKGTIPDRKYNAIANEYADGNASRRAKLIHLFVPHVLHNWENHKRANTKDQVTVSFQGSGEKSEAIDSLAKDVMNSCDAISRYSDGVVFSASPTQVRHAIIHKLAMESYEEMNRIRDAERAGPTAPIAVLPPIEPIAAEIDIEEIKADADSAFVEYAESEINKERERAARLEKRLDDMKSEVESQTKRANELEERMQKIAALLG